MGVTDSSVGSAKSSLDLIMLERRQSMRRIIVIAGATLVFAGAFASTGSAAATDPSAASKAALVALGAVSDAPALVISKRDVPRTTRPAPRPRPTREGTRAGKK